MTFDEAVNKYLDEHGDFGTAMHFGQAMYEAGKSASRRPKADIERVGNSWVVVKLVHGIEPYQVPAKILIRGGFVTSFDAREWARSNGYDV